uniref:Uncharacterized protein n=1 Tax=Arundo donax TaxID=35708 RepID=A0A0A9C0W3_ARUDO
MRLIVTYAGPIFPKIEDLADTSWRSCISLFLLTVQSFVFAHRIYMEVHISHTRPGTNCIHAHRLTHTKLHNIHLDFLVGKYVGIFGNICVCVAAAEDSCPYCSGCTGKGNYTLTSHTVFSLSLLIFCSQREKRLACF